LGRSEEAVASLDRAFRLAEDLARRDPDDFSSRIHLAAAGITLADILRHSDPRRALAVYDHTLRRVAEVKNNPKSGSDEIMALAGSTYPLRSIGDPAESRRRLDAAFSRLRQLKLYPAEQIRLGSEADLTLRALADQEAGDGNIPSAIEIYEKLLPQILAAKPQPETRLTDGLRLSRIYAAMAALHRTAGQADLASSLDARRRDLWRQWDRKLPNNAFVHRQLDVE
jgi:tetratricopeptide (TPR) repeat protein